ncbi:MAG: division/cell wall cluster transcriptional repressor MraZ [Chloroflexota bacterium]
MFLGQYRHSLDSKNRLTIPSRYREMLAEGAYVTRGFDGNLIVYTAATFHTITRQASETSVTDQAARQLKRLLFSNADFIETDRAGRILIPDFLRESAGLENEVVLAGMGDHFEIWAPERWMQQMEQLDDPAANAERFANLKISTHSNEQQVATVRLV